MLIASVILSVIVSFYVLMLAYKEIRLLSEDAADRHVEMVEEKVENVVVEAAKNNP